MKPPEVDEAETLYRELTKWERHGCGHSPGYLSLSRDTLRWEPHRMSILAKGFELAIADVMRVEESDNWLWRGAVSIVLKQPFRQAVSFRLDPDALVDGMEEHVFDSATLRLFLGFHQKRFLRLVEECGITVVRRGR
jgi:hypothetical protein